MLRGCLPAGLPCSQPPPPPPSFLPFFQLPMPDNDSSAPLPPPSPPLHGWQLAARGNLSKSVHVFSPFGKAPPPLARAHGREMLKADRVIYLAFNAYYTFTRSCEKRRSFLHRQVYPDLHLGHLCNVEADKIGTHLRHLIQVLSCAPHLTVAVV